MTMISSSSSSRLQRRRRQRRRRSNTLLATVTALHLLLPCAVRALDADCQPTDGAEPYTGYSLKLGHGCHKYVYCTGGSISSTHECASGLLFNGDIGVGGICDWAVAVKCATDDSHLAVADDDADASATMTTTTTRQDPDVPPSLLSSSNSGSGGGNDMIGAIGTYDNPNSFFCGESEADAAELCKPCPSGKMIECAEVLTHGCFKGITSCAESFSVSAGAGSGGTVTAAGTQAGVAGDALAADLDSTVSLYQGQEEARPNDEDAGPESNYEDEDEDEEGGDKASGQRPNFAGAPSTPIPSLSPTLPPYSMAPFVPSRSSSSKPKTVIGYYASWQWYDRNKLADPVNVDFTKYTRINYAFFQPDAMGNLFGTDEWADPQLLFGPYIHDTNQQSNDNKRCSWDGPGVTNCNHHDTEKGLLHLAQSRGVEVWPSIGGWTLSDNFPVIAANSELREHFAQQCVDLIKAYGFDGIDIDWEYPGYEDHSGTPADTENFTLLLQAVRTKLGGAYGLTAALPCGPDKIEKIQVSEIQKYLTEFNLMSYDMHGAWDTLTGTNAPMFDQGWGDKTRRWSTHGCVEAYVGHGVPLAKMNIGIPFYGRSFQKATGMKQFHGGADDINFHLDEGSPQYFNIVNELGRMTTYRHEATQTQYAVFNSGDRGMVSYDDPRAICDKVHYANERGLNGFLVWEISGDMIDLGNGQITTPLIDATNAKILNPSLNCSGLRDPEWALSDQAYLFAPDEPDTVDWSNYIAPISMGSANDFNGAQEEGKAIPAPGTPSLLPPSSSVGSDTVDLGSSPSDSGEGCPLDYTGYYATARCEAYVYCTEGEMVGAILPCVPGTLFDVTIGVCTWADNVQCGS